MHDKISDREAQNCFKGFKEDSYIALQIRSKSDSPEAVNLEELKGKVEENSITSTQKFVEKLGHSYIPPRRSLLTLNPLGESFGVGYVCMYASTLYVEYYIS
ncbi:hypothetical protein AVEN_134476-1 [Araneus ventricosus]|uniref:Uncharacterized protein n=1 Tax=Araneus ventricosus TaxID=182803 RepID=A0A4Y2MH67_ARAVE|nr:hypothetical protein AVEN_134476-1 [Araneus ventricosus]